MHRWNYIEKALEVRKQAFLPPARTINFPALHAPLPAGKSSEYFVYLSLNQL
jgi:hypothetical protein